MITLNEYFKHNKINEMSNVEQQAMDFADNYGVELDVISKKYGFHLDDTKKRWIYKVKLSRYGKSYTFDFGQSIGDEDPTMYDVLFSLQKYDVGSYDDFLSDFGYEKSRESKKIYHAVKREYQEVYKLFSDVMDELSEIQ